MQDLQDSAGFAGFSGFAGFYLGSHPASGIPGSWDPKKTEEAGGVRRRTWVLARGCVGLTRAATRQSSQKIPLTGMSPWRWRRRRHPRRIPSIFPHLDHTLARPRAGSQPVSQTARRPERPVYTQSGILPHGPRALPVPIGTQQGSFSHQT